jgi:hypothetical protein
MKPPRSKSQPSSGFRLCMFGLLTVLAAGLWSYWRNKPQVSPVVPVVETAARVEPVAVPTPAPLIQPQPPAPTLPAAAPASLEERWGFRVSGLSLINDGTALKLDYEVTTPAKLWPLANGLTPAYLFELASGTGIPLNLPPEQGPLPPHPHTRGAAILLHRSGGFPASPNRLVVGQTISIVLPNPEGLIKSGSQVVMVVGGTPSGSVTVP